MSDRLDRIEAILGSFVDSMADLKTKQEVSQLQQEAIQRQQEATQRQIDSLLVAINQTNNIVTELANVVYAVSNRQEDHEHRIDRLEDRL